MEKLYDVKSAAETLGDISPSTVRAWLSQGRLNRTKLGRRTMVSHSELERFVREGQRREGGNSKQSTPKGAS
jgi:excisionase family DNA binding protein